MTPKVYLPVVMSPGRLFDASLGAQIEGDVAAQVKWMADNRAGQWPLHWSKVELTHGEYTWPKLYDSNAAALAGYEQIITVKGTPAWARLWDDVGSPPAAHYYPDCKRFIQAVQARYNPKAIEFMNEANCEKGQGSPDFYGAWKWPTESWYQAGRRYGEAVAAIYPGLGSKLLAGALMANDGMVDFLRGAVDAGMDCDAVSYHCYIRAPEQYTRILELAGQISALTDKRLVVTETSLLGSEDTEELRTWQAEYLRLLISCAGHDGIELINWYDLAIGFDNGALVRHGQPTPVYEVWAA